MPAFGNYIFGYSDSVSGTNVQLVLNGGTSVLNATQTGWYTDYGENNTAEYGGNYLTGYCELCLGQPYMRGFFVFDLSDVANITSAELNLHTFQYQHQDYAPISLYLYDVTTPYSSFQTFNDNEVAAYQDLGTGILYGTRVYTAADNYQFRTVTLNSAAISDLQNSIGGKFVIGSSIQQSESSNIPEPSTYVLSGGALAALWIHRRKSSR